MKHRPIVVLAVSLAGVAAVAGITLGVMTLLGVTFQGEGTQPAEGAQTFLGEGIQPAEGADSSSRGRGVAVCLQAVEIGAEGQPLRGAAAIEESAKPGIEAALTVLEEHPYWDDAGFGVAAPVLDIGCPSPPLAVLGGPLWVNGRPNAGVPVPHVDEPSPYWLFVFVMPSVEDIHRVLGGQSRRAVAQEFTEMSLYREGPTLVHTSYGLYLTAEEIQAGGPFLARAMARGLGLESLQ